MTAGHFQDPLSDRNDHAGLFGHANERVRGDQSMNGVTPANESFEFADATTVKIHDRLVENVEFASFDRVTKVGLKLQHVKVMRVHIAIKDLISCFAGLLGAIHCGVGVAKKVVSLTGQIVRDDHTDTCGREHFIIVDLEGAGYLSLQTLGNAGHLYDIAGSVEKDREFVTAQPCYDIAGPDRCTKPFSN